MAVPERPGRRVVASRTSRFQAYDLEGPVQPEMAWLPVSYDRAGGSGCYLMRMEPGAVTIAHEHPGVEDFLILEGELIDDDGAVFRPGDFVSYAPGTRHNSRTETGCLIAVFEWKPGVAPASSHDSPQDQGDRDGAGR
jgi:anti-sigma factor ChrR (cupin superfamily)